MILSLSSDGDFPDESSTLSKLSKKSKPRSRSVDRDRSSKAGGGRSVSVSEDSGNSSLNTYATDTIQTNTSDWVHAPQRLSQLISKLIVFIILFSGPDPIEDTTTWDGINDDDSDDKMIR